MCVLPGYSGRCVRPVLLDPLDLHNTPGPLPARGQRRGPPGGHDEVIQDNVNMSVLNKICFSAHDQEDERRYVTYYQWVGFTLFFQVSPFFSLLKFFDPYFKSPYIPQIRLWLSQWPLALTIEFIAAQSFNKQGDTFVSVLCPSALSLNSGLF